MQQSVRLSRRQFLYAAGASTASLVIAACVQTPGAPQAEGAGAGQAPVTLKLWKAPHKPAGEEVKIAEDVLNGFHERQADIRVEYTEVPWAQYGEALTAGYASDDPPDVAYQTEGISRYALPGQLEALDSWFELAPGLKEQFRPQTFSPATIEGKLYGAPWVLAGNVQLWNKTLFEQAGLDPNKPPDSWDEIVEYGKKLTNPDQDQFGFMIGPQTALEFHGW
ncbi:MAG TPA: extracellular solute-binding protein, partial [Caldilineaceae bacterium]|nr:extracellular solute-binding protein [Caldilineaceae bacterium]